MAPSNPIPLAQEALRTAVHARGDSAAQILDLTWILLIAGGLIFLGVCAAEAPHPGE